MKCPSIHKWCDLRCTLESGHDGYCCSKAMRNPAAELLGLGVAWLVGNLGDTIIGKPNHGGYGVRDTWMVPRVHTRGGSLLAAVYAAIAEVKRGS